MKRKVYLPKWQKWYIGPLLVVVWLVGLYQEFFSGKERELGNVGFALFTLILLGVGSMIWLMASGKLPAYVIDEGDEEKDKSKQDRLDSEN